MTGITYNGSAVSYTTEVIKGINYAFFDANNGNYVANYGTGAAVASNSLSALSQTDMAMNQGTINATKASYFLGQNYPNPGKQFTTIMYIVPENTSVDLSLFDLQGRKVKGMVSEFKTAGVHRYTLDLKGLSPGLYIYKMQTSNYSSTKRLIVE